MVYAIALHPSRPDEVPHTDFCTKLPITNFPLLSQSLICTNWTKVPPHFVKLCHKGTTSPANTISRLPTLGAKLRFKSGQLLPLTELLQVAYSLYGSTYIKHPPTFRNQAKTSRSIWPKLWSYNDEGRVFYCFWFWVRLTSRLKIQWHFLRGGEELEGCAQLPTFWFCRA